MNKFPTYPESQRNHDENSNNISLIIYNVHEKYHGFTFVSNNICTVTWTKNNYNDSVAIR